MKLLIPGPDSGSFCAVGPVSCGSLRRLRLLAPAPGTNISTGGTTSLGRFCTPSLLPLPLPLPLTLLPPPPPLHPHLHNNHSYLLFLLFITTITTTTTTPIGNPITPRYNPYRQTPDLPPDLATDPLPAARRVPRWFFDRSRDEHEDLCRRPAAGEFDQQQQAKNERGTMPSAVPQQ